VESVLIVAADPIYRLGLVTALRGWARVSAVHDVESVGEARRIASGARVDLVVQLVDAEAMDTSRSSSSALEPGLREVGENQTLLALPCPPQTVVLLRHPQKETVQRVWREGARGVLDAALSAEEFLAGVGQVADGEVVLQPSLVRHLMADGTTGFEGTNVHLNDRELTVLQLLARGYATKQVAAALDATPKAIDLLIERVCRRLGAAHRAQAVAIAVRRSLVV
jgi:DNA-binding NarL/FixJ family response regulator